jgi:hypothetical protein
LLRKSVPSQYVATDPWVHQAPNRAHVERHVLSGALPAR